MIKLTYDDKDVLFGTISRNLILSRELSNNKRSSFFCVGQLPILALVQNFLQNLDIGLIGNHVCSVSNILYRENAY